MYNIYEMKPDKNYCQQKSFYGKANIVVDDGGYTLFSYGTKIMKIDRDGNIHRFYDGYSLTTGRHIKNFVGIQLGKPMNKKQFMELPVEKEEF